MNKINCLVFFCFILAINVLANPKRVSCRYEDGFYECHGYIRVKGKDQIRKVNKVIIEIEGCLMKHIVESNDSTIAKLYFQPKELDDSGVVELTFDQHILTISIGKEVSITP